MILMKQKRNQKKINEIRYINKKEKLAKEKAKREYLRNNRKEMKDLFKILILPSEEPTKKHIKNVRKNYYQQKKQINNSIKKKAILDHHSVDYIRKLI